MKKRYFLILIIIALGSVAIMPGSRYDSLLEYTEFKDDEQKLDFIDSLVNRTDAVNIYDKINLAKSALKFSTDSDNPEKQFQYLIFLGRTYFQIGNNKKSLEYILEALKTAKILNDQTKIATASSNIGIMYAKLGNNREARKYFNNARDIFIRLDSAHYLSGIYNNLSVISSAEGDQETALKYMKESLALLAKHRDTLYSINPLTNLCELYSTLNEKDSSNKYLFLAEEYAGKSNDLITRLNVNILKSRYLFDIKKDDSALALLFKSKEIAEENGFDKIILKIQSRLIEFYESKSDFANAYNELKQNILLTDSIEKKMGENEIGELLFHYEQETSNDANRILEQENKIQFMYIQLLIIIIVFGLSVGLLLIWKYKTKRNDNQLLKEKTELLETAYEKLNEQNKLISDQKEELLLINEELKIRSLKLKESNESKDKLFSIIAHDLRNPLNALVLATDMLVQDSDEIDKENLNFIYSQLNKSVYRLSELLDNLLDWARTQTGRIEYMPKHIDLNNLILRNIDLFHDNAVEKNINIQYIPSEGISVFADINMLDTIIRNIISNAVKFTVPNGKITMKVELINKSVKILFIDNGIGIEQEMIERILDDYQYFSTSGTRSEKGTGLGLKIVKEFIEVNQGRMEIKSSPDNGTIIELVLPTDKTD